MLLPGRLTPERRRIIQEITDQAYAQFVDAVAEGRGLPRDDVEALATGQPYTGQQALELGLVDVLGGIDAAIDEAEALAGIEDARVVEYEPSLFDLLFSGSGVSQARSMLSAMLLGEEVALLQRFLAGASGPRYGGT